MENSDVRIEWQLKLKDPRYLEVRVDGELWKDLSRGAFRPFLKKLKGCSSREELELLFVKIEVEVAKNKAFELLARRDHFAKELMRKLLDKKLSKGAALQAIERCRSMGYLDEKRLETFFVAALKRKGKGPRYISQKFKERSGKELSVPRNREEEQEEIRSLIDKRSSRKTEHQTIRFLLSRGYSLDLILQEIRSFS